MAEMKARKLIHYNIAFSVLYLIFILGSISFYFLHIKPYNEFNEKHHDEVINNITSTSNIEGLRNITIRTYSANEETLDTLISGTYLMTLLCFFGVFISLANIRFLHKNTTRTENDSSKNV